MDNLPSRNNRIVVTQMDYDFAAAMVEDARMRSSTPGTLDPVAPQSPPQSTSPPATPSVSGSGPPPESPSASQGASQGSRRIQIKINVSQPGS
jgi:hypothetical protein